MNNFFVKEKEEVVVKITILNYNMGNIKSVYNALKHLGAKPIIANAPSEVKAGKIIIPGVGAFGKGMNNLKPLRARVWSVTLTLTHSVTHQCIHDA